MRQIVDTTLPIIGLLALACFQSLEVVNGGELVSAHIENAVPGSTPTLQACVMDAGRLRFSLDGTGKIIELMERGTGTNYSHATQASYLLDILEYGKKTVLHPVRLQVLTRDATKTKIELDYDGGATVTIEMHRCADYLRMAVVDAKSAAGISEVHWGPYATSMEGPIAEYLGMNRSDTFTISLLGLNVNTDGEPLGNGTGHAYAAQWLPDHIGGSALHLISRDRSRAGEYAWLPEAPMQARAVPGVTVVGSAVALFGCRPADELKVVETVELAEGLPHPMLNGQWAKRAPSANESSNWSGFNEASIAECIAMTKEAGMKVIVGGDFGNWGHFDPDLREFPRGAAGMLACSEKAAAEGIRTTMYTLTTFIRPKNQAEPYVSPPDSRLQIVLPATRLAAPLDKTAPRVILAGGNVTALNAFNNSQKYIVKIDQELASYQTATAEGTNIVLSGCQRGLFFTSAADHPSGAPAVRMCFSGYDNFYPGTEEMNAEVASNIAQSARKYGKKLVVLDGLEATYSAGHDVYSQNSFLRTIYDQFHGDDITYTSSCFGQYGWHVMTFESWGEGNEKGFRGDMLDYRLWRQIQMLRNHMPSKMGQYHPSKITTLEDIEWLMALAAGNDAGVDLTLDFPNPHRREILAAVRNWDEARLNHAFTEEQKLQLRQTDCLFTLVKKSDGGWEPKFTGRWRDQKQEIIPSSAAKAKSLDAKTGHVEPCGIDFGWSHNPGIDLKSCFSDDLVLRGGRTAGEFECQSPYDSSLQFVLRLPADAPCAVRNPCIIVEGRGVGYRKICITTTLEPGQYIATPHVVPMAYVYNANHQVIREVPIRDLPSLGPYSYTVKVSAEPVDSAARPEIRANLLFQAPRKL